MSLKVSISTGILFVCLIFFLNFSFLRDFFGYGLVNEDIPYLRDYKSYNLYFDNNYLTRIYKIWTHGGPNWAHQILYMGTIDDLFPYNWELIQKLNFIWKVLASLSIFIVLWVLTKRKFLAILATLIYTILPPANGSLGINCTGTEYWGVIFLNLFIVSYYFLIRNQKSIKLLLLSFILLYIAIFSATTRMIPTLVLLAITEIIIVISGKSKWKTSFLRALIYIVPFYLIFRLVDPGLLTRGDIYSNLLKDLFAGNWQLLIVPLSGLGFSMMTPTSITYLGGDLNWRSMGTYFGDLLGHGVIPLLLVTTLFLGLVISKKPKRFILVTASLNFIFLILTFIFSTHYFHIPKQAALPYNGTLDFSTIPGIVGEYIVAIALATGFEWYKSGRKDKMLLLIFIAPLLSLSFIGATWLSVGKHYGYESSVHRYLTLPAVGLSIFISSILILLCKKIQTSKKNTVLYILFLATFLIYFVIFSYQGNQYFKMIKSLGENMTAQKKIQELVLNVPAMKRDNVIFYYEPRLVTPEDRYWYTALNYGRMTLWVYLHKYYEKPDRKINGCLEWVDNGFKEFKNIYKYSNNQATFNVKDAFCFKDSLSDITYTHSFYQDDFFAFTLKGGQVVDITNEVLERLKKEFDNNTNPI